MVINFGWEQATNNAKSRVKKRRHSHEINSVLSHVYSNYLMSTYNRLMSSTTPATPELTPGITVHAIYSVVVSHVVKPLQRQTQATNQTHLLTSFSQETLKLLNNNVGISRLNCAWLLPSAMPKQQTGRTSSIKQSIFKRELVECTDNRWHFS